MPQIDSLRSPLSPRGQGQISADGHSALVQFRMKGSADSAADQRPAGAGRGRALDQATAVSPSPSSATRARTAS